MARKAEQVDVGGLSWLGFGWVYRLVWLSFRLVGLVGFRGKSDKKRPRVLGLSPQTPFVFLVLVVSVDYFRKTNKKRPDPLRLAFGLFLRAGLVCRWFHCA